MRLSFDRVLVTGGSGFIGSHTVDELLDAGTRTWVADNLSSGSKANLRAHFGDQHFRFVRADVRSSKSMNELAKRVDAIIHLAAIVSPFVSMRRPELTEQVNVYGTLNILNAASRNDVRRVVFASSSSVYGDTGGSRNIDEHTENNPITPYGVSKLAGEKYCRAYSSSFGTSTISLRYFNVYGERQSSNPYSGVIAIFANAALRGRKAAIFGNGKQTRDFIYVRDVARANIAALNIGRPRGEAFNIGTGIPTSINALYTLIARITASNRPPIKKAKRQGDIRNSCANTRQAEKQLKFKAQVHLPDGLKRYMSSLRGFDS